MFLTLAAVYTVGGVVYVILGSSEELPWYTKAKQDDDNKQEESKEISTISVTVIEKMKKSRDIFLKI